MGGDVLASAEGECVVNPWDADVTRILQETAQEQGTSVKRMISGRKFAHLVKARMVAAKRLRKETDLGLKAIGMVLGGRDHSTVIHAIGTRREQAAAMKRWQWPQVETDGLIMTITWRHADGTLGPRVRRLLV